MSQTKRPRKPRLLSLCSGIGGIDLAWEMAGGEIAGQCELDPFCQQVLARHWPNVPRVSDIRSVWGDSFDGPIDLIAGGIPCQPWSVAGRRRGHADERHLWPQMLRIVEIYQPAWVLVENVAGFVGLALDGVLADLESRGYEAGAIMVPAAAVGAPHLRERVFVVAHHDGQRRLDGRDPGRARRVPADHDGHAAPLCPDGQELQPEPRPDGAGVAHAAHGGLRRGQPSRDAGQPACGGEDVADATSRAQRRADRPTTQRALAGRGGEAVGVGQADTASARLSLTRRSEWPACGAQRGAGLEPEPQRHGGRQTQSRMGGDADGLPRGLDGAALTPPRHSWPAGPGAAQYEWEPPRTTTERIPDRAARLKALGNAVVPQQVYPILAAIIEQIYALQAQQGEAEATA